MANFTHHIFVCCNQRSADHSRGCCNRDGSGTLRELFKAEVNKRGLKPEVRANKAGCLDQCELGPTVVIYPQGIWYGGVRPADVPRIIKETVMGGKILDDLQIPVHRLNTKGKPVSPDPPAGSGTDGCDQ